MNIRHRLKTLLERALGVRFFRTLPHGVDFGLDLARRGVTLTTVLDIGANEGQTVEHIMEAFPRVTIHCFEPVQATFEQLRRRVGCLGVRCVQKAVGRTVGEAAINVAENSLTNSLVTKPVNSSEQRVDVTTVDAYAAEQGIGSIDLLKVDTEGFDLEVLAGAGRCFAERRVRFVLIEAGFHFEGQAHVQYERIHEHLTSQGFELFGFYNQTPCRSGANRLRFADALFALASIPASRNIGSR